MRQKVVLNVMYDFTEQVVSRVIKFKPNIAALPVNDEQEDFYSAKVAKNVYDYLYEKNRLDSSYQRLIRYALMTGEGWNFIEWDADKGDEIEGSKILRKNKSTKVPIESGEGKPVEYDVEKDPVMQGDLGFSIVGAHNVRMQKRSHWDDVEYIIRDGDYQDTEALKQKYPQAAGKIKQNKEKARFDWSSFKEEKMSRESEVLCFYHKVTRQMPKGFCVYFTRDAILKKGDLPYSHGEFPCERLIDIEVPDDARGHSRYNNVRHLQAHINNLTAMEVRNQYMVAHPKIAVPQGSTKLESLGNDITVVQYRGAVPPQVLTFNPTSPQTTELRNRLVQEAGQIFGVHPVSRGVPPPGIKAGVALQFLAEQEHERQNSFVANFNEFVRRSARKMVSTAGDFYEADDKRKMQIVGKNNEILSDYIDPKHMTKQFNFIVQNASSLPQTQAARSQYILDMNESFPGMYTPEQVVEMLDLPTPQRFVNEVGAAVQSAEHAFEAIMDGKPVQDPQEWEDHFNWWSVFSAKIQSTSFAKLQKDRKDLALKHLLTREMLLVDKARKNPALMQQLQANPKFPMIFDEALIPPPPPMPPPEEMGPPPEEMGDIPPEEMGPPPMGEEMPQEMGFDVQSMGEPMPEPPLPPEAPQEF
jgi:hypothetical protein